MRFTSVSIVAAFLCIAVNNFLYQQIISLGYSILKYFWQHVSAAPSEPNSGQIDLFGWGPPKTFKWNKYYQCFTDVLSAVAKVYDLEETWFPYRNQIQIHINRWKKCAKDEDKEAVDMYVNIGCTHLVIIYYFSYFNSFPAATLQRGPVLTSSQMNISD